MRLRDLDITLGSLSPGPANAISDVPGVRVGHVDVVEGGLSTGITLVVPDGAGARRRLHPSTRARAGSSEGGP